MAFTDLVKRWNMRPVHTPPTLLLTGNNSKCIAFDGSFAYSGSTSDSVVSKILPGLDPNTGDQDVTLAATVTIAGGLFPQAMATNGVTLWIGCSGSPGTVKKVTISSFTETGSQVLGAGFDSITRVMYDGTYLYALCGTSPTKIAVLDPTSLTILGTFTFAAGENLGNDIAYDNSGNIYVSLVMAPGRVTKLARNSGVPTRTADFNCPTTYNEASAVEFDRVNGVYLYVGAGASDTLGGSTTARVFKVKASDMSLVDTVKGLDFSVAGKFKDLQFPSADSGLILFGLRKSASLLLGNYSRFDTGISGGEFRLFGSRSFNFGDGFAEAFAVKSDGSEIWVGTMTTPAKVQRFNAPSTGVVLFPKVAGGHTFSNDGLNEEFNPISDSQYKYVVPAITRTQGHSGRKGRITSIIQGQNNFIDFERTVDDTWQALLAAKPFCFIEDFANRTWAASLGNITVTWPEGPLTPYAEVGFDYVETAI